CSSFGFSVVLGCSLGTFASCSSSCLFSLTAVSFSFFTCSFFSCFLLCLGFSSVLGGVLLVCLSVCFLISFLGASLFLFFFLCFGFSSVLGGLLLVCLSVCFLISFLGASLFLFSFTATDFLIMSKISPECLSILILYLEFS